MTRREGGTNVKNGFYWNLASWEMVMIPRQGGVLPGDASAKYVRVPVFALLVLAPVMGGLYAIFLPFIGFAMFFSHLARQTGRLAVSGVMEMATVVTPQWAPGQAYLARKRRAKAARVQGGSGDARLERLEREIDDHRHQK